MQIEFNFFQAISESHSWILAFILRETELSRV